MELMDKIISKAKANKKTIVLPEGEDIRIITAASLIGTLGVANIVVLGNIQQISQNAKDQNIDLSNVTIIQPDAAKDLNEIADAFYEMRKAKGVTKEQALETTKNSIYYGTMMVKLGKADGLVGGACTSTGDTLRPALQIIKTAPGVKTISSCFIMTLENSCYGEKGVMVFADCAINIDPTAEQLADIAIASAATGKSIIGFEPLVAMLSFSTKGSAKHEKADKVVEAVRIAKEMAPTLQIDGEFQADAALVEKVGQLKAPGSTIAGHANVLVFPDLQSGNIGYKLVQRLAGADAIGPICQGFAKPINDLSRGCSVEDVVNVVAMTSLQAQG